MTTTGWVLSLAVAAAGCVTPKLVECSDGRTCPVDTVCDVVNATCLDPARISVSPSAIDFADVACGSNASLVVPIRNLGAAPIEFEAGATITGVTVVPSAGSIAVGGSVELVVTAAPESHSIPGTQIVGTLVISTSVELLERPIVMTTTGAVVATDAMMNFGETGQSIAVTRMLTIRNTGTAGVDVAIDALAAPFTVSGPAAVHVDAAGTGTLAVAFAASAIATYDATAALGYTGNLCEPPPTSVALHGVTSGSPLLVDHTELEFDAVACGAIATSSPLGLTNNLASAQDLALTITGTNPAGFTVAPTAMVGGGPATVALTIGRAAIPETTPLDQLEATLHIVATPSNEIKDVVLRQKLVAPRLVSDAQFIDFGTVPRSAIALKTVRITNTGTAVAAVRVNPPSFDFRGNRVSVSPTAFQVAAGGSVPVQLSLIGSGTPTTFADAALVFEAIGQCSAPPKVLLSGSIE